MLPGGNGQDFPCRPPRWHGGCKTRRNIHDSEDPEGPGASQARRRLGGWGYPKHLANRVFSVIVHGDAAGTESVRRALSDWMTAMAMIDGGASALLDRYIGYYEPYATSHEALDKDVDLQEETRVAARSLARATQMVRHGRRERPDAGLSAPREK